MPPCSAQAGRSRLRQQALGCGFNGITCWRALGGRRRLNRCRRPRTTTAGAAARSASTTGLDVHSRREARRSAHPAIMFSSPRTGAGLRLLLEGTASIRLRRRLCGLVLASAVGVGVDQTTAAIAVVLHRPARGRQPPSALAVGRMPQLRLPPATAFVSRRVKVWLHLTAATAVVGSSRCSMDGHRRRQRFIVSRLPRGRTSTFDAPELPVPARAQLGCRPQPRRTRPQRVAHRSQARVPPRRSASRRRSRDADRPGRSMRRTGTGASTQTNQEAGTAWPDAISRTWAVRSRPQAAQTRRCAALLHRPLSRCRAQRFPSPGAVAQRPPAARRIL